MQYYYKAAGCKAVNYDRDDCICWHDEDDGPCAYERHDPTTTKMWRLKPKEVRVSDYDERADKPEPSVPVRELEELIDERRSRHPGSEWTLTVSSVKALINKAKGGEG